GDDAARLPRGDVLGRVVPVVLDGGCRDPVDAADPVDVAEADRCRRGGSRSAPRRRECGTAHPNVTAAHTRAHTTTAVPTTHTSRLRIPCAFSCHASYSPATHASRDARSVLARPAHGGESGPYPLQNPQSVVHESSHTGR